MKYRKHHQNATRDNNEEDGNAKPQVTLLEEYLYKTGACTNNMEASIIAGQILEESGITTDMKNITDMDELKLIADILDQYVGFDSNEHALESVKAIFCIEKDDDDNNSLDDATDTSDNDDDVEDISTIDENDYLVDGECELCERKMKLTKHHLIPKYTHSKLKKRLLHALTVSPNSEKSIELLNHFDDYPTSGASRTKSINLFLSRTCTVCRPCHSHLHKLHDEYDLALNYNTVDKLLDDDNMRKFCIWSNKQRVGAGSNRYKSGHNLAYKR